MPTEFSIVAAFAEATHFTEAAAAEVLAEVAAAIWDDATERGAMFDLVRGLAAGDPAALARLAQALPYPPAKSRSYLEHAAKAFIAQSEIDAANALEPMNSVWVEVGRSRQKPPVAAPLSPSDESKHDVTFRKWFDLNSFTEFQKDSFRTATNSPAAPGGGRFGRIAGDLSSPGGVRGGGDVDEPGPVHGDFQLEKGHRYFGAEPNSDIGGGIGIPLDASDSDPIALAEPDADEFRVWFGTDRKPLAGDKPRFGKARNGAVSYGYCDVYVPDSHKIGSIGSSFIRRLVTRTDDRLKLSRTCPLGAEAYWSLLQSQLEATDEGKRHAVVFIHGYNVAFEDAALRAAQLGVDLGIEGAMAFFSWPSKGTFGGYQADQSTIEASEPAITQFLVDFARKSGADAVHVIAHSMGNRGVLRAVSRIVQDAQQRSGVEFANFILAAPDVDAGTFANLAKAYVELGKRTTLYVSQTDLAVGMSQWLSQYPRVGYAPPVTVLDGIDTINVTNVDVTLLGHGYVADAREVLSDMHALIFENAPPDQRFGLRPAKTAGGQPYWKVGA
jgi:esterase/lipase superfamily enzyme